MIANARMYAINETVASAWHQLFEWVARKADVPLDMVAHPAPQPLAELWQRDDLACALMCGYPWATWAKPTGRPIALAAPVPSPRDFGSRPIYWTDIVVRADSQLTNADDLAGVRFAFTVEDSQSGYQAPRRFFAERARARGGRLFAATIGPLVTPRRVAEAIVANDADAGPLDAWWHALLRQHEPALARKLRVVATTAPTPIPLVVCSSRMPEALTQRLAMALEGVERECELDGVRDALLLARFARPDTAAYASLIESARAADALGYHRLR